MSSSTHSNIAVVTGVSGFVAGVLVSRLLQKGYRVHGTVRSLKDDSKVKHFLDEFSSALSSKQLVLFEADLGVSGSFSSAIKGATYVFHTASPFFLGKTSDPQKDFVDPAVNGTANVLSSAFAEESVKRIVVTSSVAAIRRSAPPSENVAVISEKDWNTTVTIDAPYPYSKTQAERKAWEMFEEHKKKGGNKVLVTVNPSLVLGPPQHIRAARDSESIKSVISFFDGSLQSRAVPPICFSVVDVRDVVDIHIAAAENEKAEGRFIASHRESYSMMDWADILGKLYPQAVPKFPKGFVEGSKPTFFATDASKTLTELGVKLIPLEQTFKDTVEQLRKFGLIQL